MAESQSLVIWSMHIAMVNHRRCVPGEDRGARTRSDVSRRLAQRPASELHAMLRGKWGKSAQDFCKLSGNTVLEVENGLIHLGREFGEVIGVAVQSEMDLVDILPDVRELIGH